MHKISWFITIVHFAIIFINLSNIHKFLQDQKSNITISNFLLKLEQNFSFKKN